MLDIYFGLATVLLVSVGAFYVAARFPFSRSKRKGWLFLLGSILATALYAICLRDSTHLVRWLPCSNLIVVGNWYPIATAIIAGLAWRHAPGGIVRRSWPPVALALVGTFAAVQPLLGTPPACADRWDEHGICRQSTPFTCTSACAATVLAKHGIPATEQEMAELCLTRRGTTWQGLYRGLKLKTAGTPFDVEVFSCSVDGLHSYMPDCLILTVGLSIRGSTDSIYERQYSWTRGTMHTVLMFSFVGDDRVEMADPDVGKEQWTVGDLEVLFRGQGMRLVPRATED